MLDHHPVVAAEVVGVEYLDEDEVEVVATSSLSVERLRPNLCLTELSMLTSRLRLFWKSGQRQPSLRSMESGKMDSALCIVSEGDIYS